MGVRKFQVFISSTYEDLIGERKAVEETIIRAGDIPVGMEAFPAADEEQFEFIKTIIDGCDYYILIIAGRYGSIAKDGQSYTEKEFRYAVSKSIPVLVFLRDELEKLPVEKSERSPASAVKLKKFIEFASDGRMRNTWATTDALKLRVREALEYAKATRPRPGWVRGDTVTSAESILELEKLRQRNRVLEAKLGELPGQMVLPPIPKLDDTVVLHLTEQPSSRYSRETVSVEGTFAAFLPTFLLSISEKISVDDDGDHYHYWDSAEVRAKFGDSVGKSADSKSAKKWILDRSSYEILRAYAIEQGFLTEGGEIPVFTDAGQIYTRRLLLASRGDRMKFEVIDGDFSDDIPF